MPVLRADDDWFDLPVVWSGMAKGKKTMRISPDTLILVGFPSNHEFVHAVPKVLPGKRFPLPVWFTVNPKKAMQV